MLSKLESVLTRKLEFYTYKKAINLPAVAFEKMSSGEIINRITNDADTLSFVFLRLLNMVTAFVTSMVLLVYIFINSWIIGLEIIVIVVILYFVIKKYNPILESIHKDRKKEQDKFISLTNESIRGIREIKTLGVKNNLINNAINIVRVLYDKSSREIDTKKIDMFFFDNVESEKFKQRNKSIGDLKFSYTKFSPEDLLKKTD